MFRPNLRGGLNNHILAVFREHLQVQHVDIIGHSMLHIGMDGHSVWRLWSCVLELHVVLCGLVYNAVTTDYLCFIYCIIHHNDNL
jgi:hypothetical protein